MAADTLKAQAQSRDLKVGHFIVEFATPGIGHMLKNAGCDFVLFDTEHSGFHHETIKSVLRYFEAARLPAIVRVPSKEYHHIARAADMGAEGIMLPMVNDAEEARAHPRLHEVRARRASAAWRWASRTTSTGAVPCWTSSPPPTRAPPSSPRSRPAPGVENADAIAALDGVDCLWVGHFDLSAARWASPASSSTRTSWTRSTRSCSACRKHGKATGRLVPDVATGADYNAKGFDFICYSGDVWAYQAAVKAGVDGIRAACGGAQVTRFKVALSGDFRKADGSPTYPSFDLSPLDRRPERRAGLCRRGRRRHAGRGARGLRRADPAGAQVHRRQRARRRQARGRGPLRRRLRQRRRRRPAPTAGIALVITPDGVRRPVAVSILTFILALSQKLLIKDRLCRQGPEGWAQRSDHMGEGLVGKTLGQLGMGNIGAEVFRLAAPFGMRFIAHDPYQDPKVAAELGVELVGLEELFRRSDFLSVSVPLSEATHHIVGDRLLAADEAHGLPHQHRARAGGRPAGAPPGADRRHHRRRRARRVRGRALPGRRADPPARQRHRGAALAVLDRRVLRRQRRRRRARGAGGDARPGAASASSTKTW